MAKSVKLSLKPEFQFKLIGIVSSEPIYRLAWLLNQSISSKLSEALPLNFYHSKKAVVQKFNLFTEYSNDQELLELVANKSAQGLLVEDHKTIDYFLKVYEGVSAIDEIVPTLKAIKNISLAIEIEPGSLKSKDRLLFAPEED